MGTCGLGDVLGLAQATDGLSASVRAAEPFGRLSRLDPRFLLLVLDTYTAQPGDTEPQSTDSEKPLLPCAPSNFATFLCWEQHSPGLKLHLRIPDYIPTG